jgi:hypothetical protein
VFPNSATPPGSEIQKYEASSEFVQKVHSPVAVGLKKP